jgi:tetratricopeptide (TPR) repeat protein
VVIRGEAGIGKTRLISELVKCASVDGLRLMKSRCYAAEENVAYGPVLDALQPFAEEVCSSKETSRYPHLRQLLRCDPERPCAFDLEADLAGERRRLYEEIVSLATGLCDRAAILWVVDDVHWIDASSASVLSYVVRRLAERPFLLLVTVRDGAELSEACLRLLQERSTDQVCATVALGPLSRDAIRSLVAGFDLGQEKGQLAEKIHRLSGGNPFLALEFLRGIGSATSFDLESFSDASLLSDRVTELLQARLQGLAPSAIRLLEAVAVLGRNAIPRHAADAADLSLHEASDVSEELYARGILRDREGRIEFVHDITREFIYGNVGGVRMASLHLFVAEALASDVTATLPTIARHFHLGGDRARAFEYALRAATSSIASFGHEEAKAMATLALSQAASDTERSASVGILGRAQFALGEMLDAEHHFGQLLELEPQMEPTNQATVQFLMARARMERSDCAGATDSLSELAETIGEIEDPTDRLAAEIEHQVLGLKLAIRWHNAQEARERAVAIRHTYEDGRRDGLLTPGAAADALCGLAAYSAFFDSVAKAAVLVEEAEATARRESVGHLQRTLLLAGVIRARQAKWDQAEHVLAEALSLANTKNQVLEAGMARNSLAYCALEQGLWDEAQRLCTESLRTYEVLPEGTFVKTAPLTNLGDVLFCQGHVRQAKAVYERALRTVAQDYRWQLHASLGLVALQLGDTRAARNHWAVLRDLDSMRLRGVQERFKVEWLRAFIESEPESTNHSVQLDDVIDHLREVDIPGYLKLKWLRVLLDPEANAAERRLALEGLRGAQMAWFASFSRRWYLAARTNYKRVEAGA